MTKRDGDSLDKMTKMDRTENSRKKSPSRAENGRDFVEHSDHQSPGKNTTVRQTSSGSFSEFSASSFRDSPRSAPSSLPGSRCGSTPGSRLASRSNSQESIIDLFDSMTLQFGQQLNEGPGQGIQLFSPKPRPLRHPKWSWQERVRINHAIWRSWHMQYVKGKKPPICQFATPTPDARQRLQADVIQGRPINKQWNPTQISSAIRDYHKWRVFSRDTIVGDSGRFAEDNAFNLDMPHPPLSPMAAQKWINDDMLRDFSDTLFISTEKKNFTVPAPKKITRHVYNSDIIQPGLMQLEPDFDQDFMDTLDSLQDILSKTPTKQDTDNLGMNYNLPPNLLADPNLGALSEAMEIHVAEAIKSTANNAYPTAIISNHNGKQVVSQRSVTFAAMPGTMVEGQFDPMVSSTALPTFSGATTPLYHTIAGSANMHVQLGTDGQNVAVAPMDGVRSGMHQQQQQQLHPHHLQLNSISQAPQNLLYTMTSSPSSISASNGTTMTLQSSMATASYQTQPTISHMSSMPSHISQVQGFTYVHPKMEAQSPTPKSPPACIQGVSLTQEQNAASMGVIAEAVDLLSSQIQSSPSKMIPDWTTQFNLQPLTSWGVEGATEGTSVLNAMSGGVGDPNIGGSGGMSKAGAGATSGMVFNFKQNMDMGVNIDPMAPMDQSTVLGHGSPYGGSELSPGHQQHHHQQHQQHQHHQQPQQQSPHQQAQRQTSMEPPGTLRIIEDLSPQSQPQQEESMEFEQYANVAGATGASGMTMYKTPKREITSPYANSQSNSRSNSKANSRANSRPGSRGNSRSGSRAGSPRASPRASYAGLTGQPFQDSLQAALQGKSDVKELGLRSPSTDRDLAISVPSSCQASTASSAASSPSSQVEYPETPTSAREHEFHPPRPKRQKTPDSGSGSKEKETRRRIKHLHSEHKRRFNIQTGLDELQGMIPGMSNGGSDNNSKISTATMLQKGHEYIVHLKEETNALRSEVEKAREEIQRVNDEICECQDSLPDTGAPVNSQSERQLQQMCNEYINKKMQENWKFWIFSMLVKPLFASYVTAVCANPGANFDEEVIEWVEESCRLKPLRKLVYTIVRQVSTRTSVLQSPSRLPEEIEGLIKEEILKPSMDHS